MRGYQERSACAVTVDVATGHFQPALEVLDAGPFDLAGTEALSFAAAVRFPGGLQLNLGGDISGDGELEGWRGLRPEPRGNGSPSQQQKGYSYQ